MSRGGARHFAKPMIETGLIFDIFFRHEDLIRNFGSYETLSTQSAVDPKGLIHNLPLVEDILEIAPSCEIHPQPLRNALVRLLTQSQCLTQEDSMEVCGATKDQREFVSSCPISGGWPGKVAIASVFRC